MSTESAPLSDAMAHARHAARVRSDGIRKLARAGYAAKGVVYLIVGLLAAMAAVGYGGQVAGSKQGLASTLAQGTWGVALVAAVGVGLLGYAAWNLLRAALDIENAGDDAKGYSKRLGFGVSAVIHAGLGVWAIRAAVHGGTGASDGVQDLTASVMGWPGGRWAVLAAGAGIVGYGLFLLFKAYQSRVAERLDLSRLGDAGRRFVVRLARFGMAARGVVFAIIGWFAIYAGWTYAPDRAAGVGGALLSLRQVSFGWLVLATVSLGLAAYGGYMIANALYRRIDVAR
jgi:hypothetical protein